MNLEVLCAGIGGRGVLLGSTILIETAIRAGYHAIASDEYGMSQRGGSVISLIKIGGFASPLIGRENADVILSFEESEFYRNLIYAKKGGMAVVNTDRISLPAAVESLLKKRNIQWYLFDADRIAREHGMMQASNMAVLGFFSFFAPELFTFEGIEHTIKDKIPEKFLVKNLAVFRDGYSVAEATGKT